MTADAQLTPQRAVGWLLALVFVILVLAGVWWWMTGTPSEAPAADGAQVGMAEGPVLLPT